jgi:hypothetical protein
MRFLLAATISLTWLFAARIKPDRPLTVKEGMLLATLPANSGAKGPVTSYQIQGARVVILQ